MQWPSGPDCGANILQSLIILLTLNLTHKLCQLSHCRCQRIRPGLDRNVYVSMFHIGIRVQPEMQQ